MITSVHKHKWIPIPGLEKFPQRVCLCGMIRSLGIQAGKNTLTVSPAGAADRLRWSATQVVAAAGDLGMDVATGRPQAFVGGANRSLDMTTDGKGLLAWGALTAAVGGGLGAWASAASALVAVLTLPARIIVPFACTIRNFYARRSVAPGGGNTCTFSLFVNAVAQPPVVTIAGAVAVTGSDLVNTFPLVAGDQVEIVYSALGVPVAANTLFSAEVGP